MSRGKERAPSRRAKASCTTSRASSAERSFARSRRCRRGACSRYKVSNRTSAVAVGGVAGAPSWSWSDRATASRARRAPTAGSGRSNDRSHETKSRAGLCLGNVARPSGTGAYDAWRCYSAACRRRLPRCPCSLRAIGSGCKSGPNFGGSLLGSTIVAGWPNRRSSGRVFGSAFGRSRHASPNAKPASRPW